MINIKILKMALAGFVLGISGFANAGLITMLITDNGTDLTMTATGDYDNTGLTNLGAIQVGVKAFVFSGSQYYGWDIIGTRFAADHIGVLTGTGSVSTHILSDISGNTPFWFNGNNDYIVFGSALIGTVNQSAVINNATLSSLGMLEGESINVTWGDNQLIIMTTPINKQVPVPAPSTLAALALGLIGLASIRFEKQT